MTVRLPAIRTFFGPITWTAVIITTFKQAFAVDVGDLIVRSITHMTQLIMVALSIAVQPCDRMKVHTVFGVHRFPIGIEMNHIVTSVERFRHGLVCYIEQLVVDYAHILLLK
jgi:hypothetical protein